MKLFICLPNRIRIQAVNNVGPGALSSSVKVATKPLPPAAPKLECVSVAHFWMKLKWNETASKNVEYLVQMINPYKDEYVKMIIKNALDIPNRIHSFFHSFMFISM